MRVQRQVVGIQVDVVVQQQSQALLQPSGHRAVLTAPEQAVVNKDRVRLGRHSRLDQRQTSRHARDDLADFCLALNLQAVGTIVFEALGLQERIESAQQLSTPGGRGQGKKPSTER